MSKYFVRYGYERSHKIPYGDGLGWKYETVREEDSCIFEMEENLIGIYSIKEFIYNEELSWMKVVDRPAINSIEILTLNKI